MKNIFTLTVLAILGLTPLHSADIGDFAPLQVGNTWKYSGARFTSPSLNSALPSGDSIQRMIVIQDTFKLSDTVVYVVEFRDSLYRRLVNGLGRGDSVAAWFDTVRESGDQTLMPRPDYNSYTWPNSRIGFFFNRHMVGDSEVMQITEGGTVFSVYDTTSTVAPVYKHAKYVKDIGLVEFNESFFWRGYSTGQSYLAKEFNGVPLGRFTIPTGIPSRRGHARFSVKRISKSGAIPDMHRNLLGRRFLPPFLAVEK